MMMPRQQKRRTKNSKRKNLKKRRKRKTLYSLWGRNQVYGLQGLQVPWKALSGRYHDERCWFLDLVRYVHISVFVVCIYVYQRIFFKKKLIFVIRIVWMAFTQRTVPCSLSFLYSLSLLVCRLSLVAYTYTFHLHHVIIHSGTYLSFLESYLLIISINPLRSALLTTFFLQLFLYDYSFPVCSVLCV